MTIEIAVGSDQPFEVELKVFEEDTWLVMSASNHIREIREPLEELQSSASEQIALPLGHLEVRGNGAYAVVHDFDQVSSFSPVAAEQVLSALSDLVAVKEMRAIALQSLGAFHGAEPLERSVQRIRETHWPECLEKLWIITPNVR